MKDITYHMGFSFGRLGHAQGWDLGVLWGVGEVKKKFLEFNQIWCVSYSHEWHMHQHNFFGPCPLGFLGGVTNLISEHGHVAYQIKGDGQFTRIH